MLFRGKRKMGEGGFTNKTVRTSCYLCTSFFVVVVVCFLFCFFFLLLLFVCLFVLFLVENFYVYFLEFKNYVCKFDKNKNKNLLKKKKNYFLTKSNSSIEVATTLL